MVLFIHPLGIGGSYPLFASKMVKICASLAAVLASASAGVRDWYHSLHMHICWVLTSTYTGWCRLFLSLGSLLLVHIMHSVGCVTGAMISCCWSKSSTPVILFHGRKGKGIDRGALTLDGSAFSINNHKELSFYCPYLSTEYWWEFPCN